MVSTSAVIPVTLSQSTQALRDQANAADAASKAANALASSNPTPENIAAADAADAQFNATADAYSNAKEADINAQAQSSGLAGGNSTITETVASDGSVSARITTSVTSDSQQPVAQPSPVAETSSSTTTPSTSSTPTSTTATEPTSTTTTSTTTSVATVSADATPPAEPAPEPAPVTPAQANDTTSTANQFFAPKQEPNILHQFASYTYEISLHMLSKDDLTTLENNTYIPTNVLIASAGMYQGARNPVFTDDFYFENLSIESVIGATDVNRYTNAVSLKFDLYEPYGLTLLDRIIAASNQVNIQNYTDLPYLLQIEFFGNDDEGKLRKLDNITKRIPIKILQLNATVTTTGAKYAIVACPFNHIAYDTTIGTVPNKIEVASNNVIGLLTNIAGAINTIYSKYAAEQKVEVADSVNFVIKEFGGSNLSGAKLVETIDTAKIPVDMEKLLTSYQNNVLTVNPGTGQIFGQESDSTGRTYSIEAGTHIDAIIGNIIKNSTFLTDQLVVAEDHPGMSAEEYQALLDKQTKAPMQWIKITPKYSISNFDNIRNTWGRSVTYNINVYNLANAKMPEAPNVPISKANTVKDYQYLYTGKNNDIRDFKIEFNTAYYTATTASRLRDQTIVNGDNTNKDSSVIPRYIQQANTSDIIQHKRQVGLDNKAQGLGRGASPAQVMANDAVSNMTLAGSAADMIHVQLNIVGDPQFIQQDDVLYTDVTDEKYRWITPNGSITTSSGAIYVHLTFLTPVDSDYDDASGLIIVKDSLMSKFSRPYQVLTVTSTFKGGKFEQQLDMVMVTDVAKATVTDSATQRTDPASTSTTDQASSQFGTTNIPVISDSATSAQAASNTEAEDNPNKPIIGSVPAGIDTLPITTDAFGSLVKPVINDTGLISNPIPVIGN